MMHWQKSPQLHKLTKALRDSDEFFHAIFERATVGIAQLSLQGRWLLLNRKICDILGYSAEELSSLTVSQIGHPDDLPTNQSYLRRMLSGEMSSCTMERRCLRKDGSVVWVNLTVTLVRNARGVPEFFLAVLEEIGERKRAEEELRQSEERFRQIFRLAPIAITITTLEGEFVDINEAGERLSGYRRDQVIGHNSHEFSVWRDAGERAEVLAELLCCGEVRDREMEMKTNGGSTFWALYSAVVIEIAGKKHLLSLVSDIGERKKAQEELGQSEEHFRFVADNAPVLIWEAGPDGACTFVNKTWLDFTGKSFEEELGEGWCCGVHPEDLGRCLDTYRTALDERRTFTMEYRLRRADGGYGWIVDTGVPRFSVQGAFLGYLGTGFDITEQKSVKEELQRANRLLAQRVEEETDERIRIGHALHDQTMERLNIEKELREKELMLLHQGRLATMGEMIGNIAHQWRQPLNLLNLLTQEMSFTWKRGEFTPEYLEKSVRKMLETIQHMSQTIGDFSNFFRPSKEKSSCRVLDAVHKTISLLDEGLRSQQIRTTVVAHGDPVVQGYPNELAQVFLNIVINAKDALVARQVCAPAITIEVSSEGERCVVTITDNAGGIPDEILDRIFEPYFTTKTSEQGSGVGLFMSRTIIEKSMGGTLTARNVPGGAEFRIEI